MANETHASRVFDVEKCRVKIYYVSGLADCLSPEQAHFCGCSQPFGYGYFCKHPRRKEFVEIAEKLRSKAIFPLDIPHSDNQ